MSKDTMAPNIYHSPVASAFTGANLVLTATVTDNLNIAYVGGGSRGWAWGFMMDLAMDEQLCGTVRLYDIDKDAARRNEIIGQKISAILVQLLLLGFDVFIIKVGFDMVQKTMTQPSPALRLPMGYVYLAVPVMGILGIWYSVLEIIKLIREKEAKADA